MRVGDLNTQELVGFDAECELIRFAGQRALIIDATAMGSLRKDLIEHFGATAARGILTRFGYVHGWRMAAALPSQFKWDSDDDRRPAGGRINMIGGMYCFQPGALPGCRRGPRTNFCGTTGRGNVRELENAMERAVALSPVSRTELDDLPEELRQAMPFPTVSGGVKTLDEAAKEYIIAVLDRNGGNQTRTAEQLGIGSATLYRKLKSYGGIAGWRTGRRRTPAKS
jgi:hypothetical protein